MSMPVGTFERKGDTFTAGAESYKVRKRAGASDKKPRLFLVRFAPAFAYVSSLYPVAGQSGVFALDSGGLTYTLTLTPTQVQLEQVALPPGGRVSQQGTA